MGQAVAALRESITAGDQEAKKDVLQQLSFLVHSANTRLEKYESDLHGQFLNQNSKTTVPGLRALRWERGYRVGIDKTPTTGISEIIDGFFGNKDQDKDKDKNPVLEGFKKVVEQGLNIILGNTIVGEHESEKFFVFAQHNAIVRIDVKMWRYNFEGKGVIAESENVLCYVFCTSIVDHNVLSTDELVYLLSEHAGDANFNDYLTFLLATWNRIEEIKKNPGQPSRIKGPEASSKEDNVHVNGQANTVAEVAEG